MADGQGEVSHGDILYKLGGLEGKIDSLVATLAQKQVDLAEAFKRIGELERRVAQGMVLLAAMTVVAPMVWSVISPHLHLVQRTPAAQVRP